MNNVDQSNEAKQAGKRFVELLNVLADVYLLALRSGLPEEEAFSQMRDAFEKTLEVSPLRAANLARILIAMMGSKVGVEVYKLEELRIIFGKAFDLSPTEIAAL